MTDQRQQSGRVSQAMLPNGMQLGIGIALTAIAGFVDACSFIELGGFFASFMSGASISLGVSACGSQWAAASHASFLIAAFVTAATVSSMISRLARPWNVSVVLLLEAICLSAGVLMIETGWSSSASVVPVVAAMGAQNTALRPLKGVRLGVTFMTGTLVSLSQALGESLIGRAPCRDWIPHAAVWSSFVAGAGAGALFHAVYGFIAIAAPTLALWTLAAFATVTVFVMVRKQGRQMRRH